ncbi:MarR family winged helix-turn-helix transcriptional regulator [Microbacterium rhizophilus]|uniref:MarR family winged helix-turn-helix transcriptional regulator n=1 Tax=Microbacterium rhizophilus TaxID=3138934 RepID=UPI0031E77CD8
MSAEASIDELEVAFASLGPLIKAWRNSVASSFHPDLRPGAWLVLRTVLPSAQGKAAAPVPVSEIIAETQLDKSVVSRQLRDLKEHGFVTLRRSDSDARVFLVEPTAEALERQAAMKRAARAGYRRVFREWDDADIATLTRLLGRLSQSAHHLQD